MTPIGCPLIDRMVWFCCRCFRRSGRRNAGRLLVALALVPALRAQPAVTASITGVVANDATRQFLDSAEVTVDGTKIKVLTDYDGTYTITGLPPGIFTLVANYAGLDPLARTVTVAVGETCRVDFSLKSKVYTMGEFVVAAEAEGSAYATNKQKKSDYFILAVSSDSFDTTADGNLGDVLKSLPGLEVNYTDANASTVSIRGQDAAMTAFTRDGVAPAAAGTPPQSQDTASRAFEFQQVAIHSIESVEIYKAPPPSMPAVLGGIVNVVSKSAFLQKGRRLQLFTTLNGPAGFLSLNDQPGPGPRPTQWVKPGGGLSYSEALLQNRLGVSLSLSASSQINPGAYNQLAYAYRGASAANPLSAGTPGYISSYTLTATPQVQQRQNVSLNFDFKLNATTTLSLRNSWNGFQQQIRQRTFRVTGGTATADSTLFDTTLTGATASLLTDYNDTRSTSLGTSLRVDHKFGAWKIDYTGGYSKSDSTTGDLPGFFDTNNVSLGGVSVRLKTAPGRPAPTGLNQVSGPDLWNLASYGTLASPQSNPRDQHDVVKSAALNIRRDFAESRFPFYLQTGGSYSYFHRDRHSGAVTYTFLGADGIAGTGDDTLSPGVFRDVVYAIPPLYGMRQPAWLDPYRVANYRWAHPSSFQDLSAANYERRILGTQQLTQEITAGYFMGNVRFGRANVLSGIRVEYTETSGVGPLKRASLGTGLPVNTPAWYHAVYAQQSQAQSDYLDPLLQVQGTYRFTPNLLFRGALYQTVGRPDIYRILQNTTVDDVARTVSINNVAVIPQHSNNLDLALEYYTKPSGSISVGWFRKSIHDYIQRSTDTVDFGTDNGFNGAYGGYTLSTQTNTGNARFEGFEASFRQQLGTYLPTLLKGFEVLGNFTQKYRAEGSFGTTAITTPLNYVPWSTNGGISYTSPGRTWYVFVRCTAIPRTLSARATATAFARYDEAHRFWDVTARYRFLRKYALELSGTNIAQDPRLKWTQGPNRPVDYREFDAQWTLTLTANIW